MADQSVSVKPLLISKVAGQVKPHLLFCFCLLLRIQYVVNSILDGMRLSVVLAAL